MRYLAICVILLCVLFLPAIARGQESRVLLDLDQDGLAEVGVVSRPTDDYYRLDVWLTSRGPNAQRPADIVITELFADQVTAFDHIGAAQDVDGDGVSEITTLSIVEDIVNGDQVPALSIYSSKHGLPEVSFGAMVPNT